MSIVDIVRAIAWVSLATVGLVTIAPLRWRAPMLVSAHADRALTFVVLAMLFAFAYPNDRRAVAIFCILGAVISELSQLISLRRHPKVNDALLKAFGALAGVLIGAVIVQLISFEQH
ncbi:VanZ family protein [Rhizobium leguminosarum]|uniref:VanZ family protein n=1 Tax=Rhizobium leguminosarum TaxID=384 RepID=A0A4Q8XVR4_RHILE|nr:VanZ family protein [Rhizobium leguminosarum]TAX64135.1 VanZ family protein [Rhizobium leguminosarum]